MKILENVFAETCAEIESAYLRLGHRMGWRFLNSPRITFASNTPIALITLNPGGSAAPPDHGRESSESGSAYIVESWPRGSGPGEAPLQREIRGLFAMLAAAQGSALSGDTLLHQSLAAYFVSFRSPTFRALEQPGESLAFASQLWTRLFKHLDPKLVITIDRRTTHCLVRILSEKFGVAPSVQSFPIGWGKYAADVLSFEAGGSLRTVLRFPHLSRFKIFQRAQSRPDLRPYLERVIAAAARGLH